MYVVMAVRDLVVMMFEAFFFQAPVKRFFSSNQKLGNYNIKPKGNPPVLGEVTRVLHLKPYLHVQISHSYFPFLTTLKKIFQHLFTFVYGSTSTTLISCTRFSCKLTQIVRPAFTKLILISF